MGTRADFYVGKGKTAEWIGSIAWDGYRDGIPDAILKAVTEEGFRSEVARFFAGRDDVTFPKEGWPWPWDDSATTDCSYWFFDGRCWDARGRPDVYTACDRPEPEWGGRPPVEFERIEFPDMSARKNVKLGGNASGMVIITAR